MAAADRNRNIVIEPSVDINHFNPLHLNIANFCKYVSSFAFKSATMLMSSTATSKSRFSALDNAQSPFIVLALAEELYHEFHFVDNELKIGVTSQSHSLSHLYAQALADLELARQYFVVQIRQNPSSRQKSVNKAVLIFCTIDTFC